MKGIITLFFTLSAVSSLMAQSTTGETFVIDQITYVTHGTNGTEVAIKKSNATTETLILPEKVSHNNKEYTVKAIYQNAFQYGDMKRIELSNSIDSIGQQSFASCSKLTSVKLPNQLKHLGEYSFSNCGLLSAIEIPETITSIPGSAFFTCKSLSSIKFPSKLKYIGNSAFYKAGLVSAELPETCDSIAKSVFLMCPNLKSVKLSSKTHFIGAGAFQGCTQLESFIIPELLDSLNESMFQDCSSLTSIHIPARIKKIGKFVFGGSGIKSYTIAEGNPAFKLVDGVVYDKEQIMLYLFPQGRKSFTIPEGVRGIWGGAFYGNEITSVVLPESLVAIDESAFANSQLSSISFPDALIYMGPTALYDTKFTSITLPKNLTTIYEGLLAYCKELTSVTIPEKVTYVDTHAFFFDTKLTEVHCLGTEAPQLYDFYEEGESPFGYIDMEKCTLFIPKGSLDSYVENNWTASFSKNNIKEVDGSGIYNTTNKDAVSVSSENGQLKIHVQEPILVEVYAISGNCIYKELVPESETIPLAEGIYMVKAGSTIQKVTVGKNI